MGLHFSLKLPYMKSPCSNCPFTKDCLEGWLGKERAIEISNASSFVCHKKNDLQCAGSMVINGNDNEFVRLAESMRIDLDIKGKNKVFRSKKEMIKHQEEYKEFEL